jgi:hypothetical protein
MAMIIPHSHYYQRFEKEENFGKFEKVIAEATNTRKSMRLEELLLQDAKERGLEQALRACLKLILSLI